MAEKRLNTRIIHKHETEANWLLSSFVPMQGELIVYDIDDNYNYERIKIGDGVQNVNALPFYAISDVEAHNTSKTAHNDIRTEIGAISKLVGDTSVADQIEAANMIYVGPDRPTDPNIKVWINTAEEGSGIVPVLPRVATITLSKSSWTGSAAPYSQVVDIATVTSATKVELNATVAQIVSLQNDDIALMAENDSGVVTVYSFGGKPSTDMTMQVTLVEVAYV